MCDVKLSCVIAESFWDVHEDIKAEKHREYWLKGGRGSTKSSFISIEIIQGMLRDPKSNAMVFRRIGNTIKDSVFEQMCWAIDILGLNAYFRTKLSPFEIIYIPTGQKIMFRGADDPMKTKSIKPSMGYFKYLWFEELAEFRNMKDIKVIKQSVFRGVERAITFYSYNPPVSAQAWVNGEALVPVKDRLVHHSTYLDVPYEWLKGEFIEEARSELAINERAYRHAYLGEITGTGGQVFYNLTLREIAQEERARFDRLYCGLDFGFAVDPDAFVLWHYDRSLRKLYLLNEHCATHTPTEELAATVLRLAGRNIVTCDSADPRMIAELRRRGIQAIAAKKGPDSVSHGMRWMQELAEIVIDPACCPCAAKEFSAYEYLQNGSGEFVAAYPDKDNHMIDATRYAMESVANVRVAKTRSDIY